MARPEDEKRTPVFDWEAGDFAVDLMGAQATATGEEAVKQIVIKALETERDVYLIYADWEDEDRHHSYGSEVAEIMTRAELPEDVRDEEIKRAIREALIFEEWINAVTDIELIRRSDSQTITGEDGNIIEIGPDEIYANFTVRSIFGATEMEGVNIFNG
jgi:hypothetical protein